MNDAMSQVVDQMLSVSAKTMAALTELRASEKFTELPGDDTTEEQRRLTALFDTVLDRIIGGIQKTPTKRWVLTQFVPALEEMIGEDTEGREHFGMHLALIMDILGIESSDGLLSTYL